MPAKLGGTNVEKDCATVYFAKQGNVGYTGSFPDSISAANMTMTF
jgi:hypothetical protein